MRSMNPRRGRGRSGGGGGNRRSQHSPNRSYDSNGPNVRIRGTATQVYDKYCALARDANSSGDRVSAENYLQHAEHYFRIMSANGAGQNQRGSQQQQQQPQQARNQQEGDTAEVPGSGPQPEVAEQTAETTASEAVGTDLADTQETEKPKRPPRNRSRRKPDAEARDSGSKSAESKPESSEEESASGAAGFEDTSVAAD